MKTIDLTGNWKFRLGDFDTEQIDIPKKRLSLQKWMKAVVPGTVHTDLLALKKIPDPFYRTNELDVQWIELVPWIYKRTFTVDSEFLLADKVELVADGLDTFAAIKINDAFVVETDNMFLEHRLDIKDHLEVGENTIEIAFDSPTNRARALEKEYGVLEAAFETCRVYVRKAQYSFGWDWGPRFATSGVWRPIRIESRNVARVESAFTKVVSIEDGKAIVDVRVELEKFRDVQVDVRIQIGHEEQYYEGLWNGKESGFSELFEISNPKLWWPNGFGEQPLYVLRVLLSLDGEEQDFYQTHFGIRKVNLIQESDAEGRSFIFEINGEKIFCKGADWIPSDNFVPRIGEEKYRRLLTMAKEANMNILRVWGGGIYEEDTFYNLCDELGIMVWQDFMYACAYYPNQDWFLAKAKQEAEKIVKRLRQHPSIVIWCGNNECEWAWADNKHRPIDEMPGAMIFRDIIAQACESLDGTRPYWRTTPFGEGYPNDETNGNHHQWKVWSQWTDFTFYQQIKARFVSEFGFQSPPAKETLGKVTLPSDRYLQSKVMEHHNKQTEAPERLYRFLSGHFKVTDDYDDLIYKLQLVQGEALKLAVEHWRRRKFWTAGSIYWQLNDCWPVFSWSSIDYDLRPKASYFYTKRFYGPVLLSLVENGDTVECWITNDTLKDISGVLIVQSENLNGIAVKKFKTGVSVQANVSDCVLIIPKKELKIKEPTRQYVYAYFKDEKGTFSENALFFERFKHVEFSKPRLRWKMIPITRRECILEIETDRFVKSLCIEIPGKDAFLSDNFFDLHPSFTKLISIRSKKRLSSKNIRIRTLV
jgi:beta-mannosidase